jgi:AAA15 family ATPase/GTPase
MNKSEMGDGIVPILNIWKNGVLIMDEVDALLHPLKSELNFPIGRKKAIDLAGYRYLVTHVLVFVVGHKTYLVIYK